MYEEKMPLIAIALMVKNEAKSICSTLSSFFEGGIRDYFILDTGSTDNTIELAQNFFTQHQLNGSIQQELFVDFATSRNRTLELAEEQYSHIPFLLMPDAEWHLHNADVLHAFCEQEQWRETPLYSLTIKMNHTEFTTARLFRTSAHMRFKGAVHEVPEAISQTKVPSPVYFQVNATSYGVEKSQKRWQQDLLLLLKAYHENSNDPRNTFYLAQTYHCLNDLENAYFYYQHREKLSGWSEENFITLLRLGTLATQIKQPNPATQWANAMDYFLKAFSLRPHRIEPLVKIADHYWPDNIPACYLFAKYAYDKPYPDNDLLFIDKEDYQYTRYEIMSRCAWHVGEYNLGKEATLLALTARPGTPHLLNNLELYQKQLNTQL